MTDSKVAYINLSAIIIYAPAVLLCTIDAVCIAAYVVDIHNGNTVIRVNSDMINIISRTREVISVSSCNESHSCFAFLLEINLTCIVILRINNHRVILLRITSTDEGNAELISVGCSLHCEGYLVVIAQAVEENIGISCECESVIGLFNTILTLSYKLYFLLLTIFFVDTLYLSEC